MTSLEITLTSRAFDMKGLGVILCCVLAVVSAQGGRPGARPGGFPAGVPGGFPGGVPGGFPGGLPGGFPAPHPGGFPSATAPPATCRRWCRTPEDAVYCCESKYEPEAPVGTKPLDCPRVRDTCPPVRFGGLAPVTCSSDLKCGGLDKCCFDRCLKEHVCKPPSFYSQFA